MAKSRSAQLMSGISAAQVTPFSEDPELLEPGEEALMQSGNGTADTAGNGETQGAEAGSEPDDYSAGRREYQDEVDGPAPQREDARESGREAESEGAERDLSDEQMRKVGPNDTVPAWSLVKERQENRELKRKLEEAARKLSEQEALWNRVNQRLQQGMLRAADPEPDAQADPATHQQWEMRQQRRALAELHQAQQLSAAHNQAVAQQTLLASMEQQFIADGHPDYFERVRFLRERRDRELEMMGYAEPAERTRIIQNEGQMLVAGAVRQGRNPAEVVHQLAQHWGYGGPAPARAGEGEAIARIRDLARNKAAAQSLQGVTGRPPQGPLTLEDFAEMDDETYDRYMEKAGGDLNALLRR